MRNKTLIYAAIVAIIMLTSVACGSQATPTPSEEPEQIEEEAQEPEEEVEEESAVLNAVSVDDQELGPNNTVNITNVAADTAGWLVIHAQSEGSPGPVLGFAPVDAGENNDVLVEIDTSGATETLYAMLHVDAGVEGEYEFPGDDGPATDAQGNVVTPPFDLTIPNSVTVVDQSVSEDNRVTIAEVVSATPGWLVVHAQADGSPGPVIGHAPVSAGYSSDVLVDIDLVEATETLYAMLHVDAGVEGEYEFPGDDGPATNAEGNVVTPPFQVDLPQSNAVTVEDQALGEDNTVTIANVQSEGPGWLVIHAQADGSPGPVIGHAPISPGENLELLVEIDAARASETLYAMLHVDAGIEGEYEFPGDDLPATDAGGNVVTPPFQVDFSGVNAVSVSDQVMGEDNTFIIASVRSAEPGWVVIHAQVDGSPGPILGFEPVAAGVNENVVVRIDIDDLTDVLYAMLHVDAGAPDVFEFPSGDDVPATDSAGNVVTPAFNRLPATVEIGFNEELGAFLVGANGLTLYRFTNDEGGESTCYDQCADAWPPLLFEEGDNLNTGPDVDGELGTTRRTDGTIQVTYDGMPIYFFAGDENFGDANGHGSGGVWFVIEP